ncbi:hypothetical protein ACFWBB_20550 [Streptomyces sp. NPDC060000]|uniref:hypothetical protein n=1 Tax=Streptomyces sp. NPDC060000 TaxID=3347031 RepID=UPI0036C1A2B6
MPGRRPRRSTSPAAIARFAADTDSDLREQLGPTSSTPNASTPGRLLARLDDAVGAAVGAWLARHAADPVEELGDTRAGLAVEGKTVRGPAPTAQPSTCSLPRATPARP